jgi:hypothetical protein
MMAISVPRVSLIERFLRRSARSTAIKTGVLPGRSDPRNKAPNIILPLIGLAGPWEVWQTLGRSDALGRAGRP